MAWRFRDLRHVLVVRARSQAVGEMLSMTVKSDPMLVHAGPSNALPMRSNRSRAMEMSHFDPSLNSNSKGLLLTLDRVRLVRDSACQLDVHHHEDETFR